MPLKDSRRWIVALTCSILNFLHLGTARLSGSMYLVVLERYQADRSNASLPFILCYTVRNISGPLIGYLSTKFGIYTVTLLGGLIAFVGIGGCYFAEDIVAVILFWGVVFGFGFGMGSVLIPEILNHHFDKYISNANGIALGGECIAGFVLPIFLKVSLNAYGTSGTFLILSSLMLNSIPATLLLKHFSDCQTLDDRKRKQNAEDLIGKNQLDFSINGSSSDSFVVEDDDIPIEKRKSISISTEAKVGLMSTESTSIASGKEMTKGIFIKKSTFNIKMHSDELKEHLLPDLKQRFGKRHWQQKPNNEKLYQQIDIQTRTSNNQDPKTLISKDNVHRSHPKANRKCKHSILLETNIANNSKAEEQYSSLKYYGSLDQGIQKFGNLAEEINNQPDLSIESHEKSTNSLSSHDIIVTLPNVPVSSLLAPSSLTEEQTSSSNPFRIFMDPAFFMILLTQSTMLYNATLFWTVIVDFSRDTRLSSEEEIYILICLSVLDMIGRLGLGWISDAGYVSNSTFSGMCCFGMGISVGSLVFLKKFATIGCSVAVFGLFLGGFLIVCPGVVNDHIHQNQRGMALASRLFLFAPMSLSQSPLIGYFRGKLGSYNYIFVIIDALCLFSTVTSLLTPYAEKFRERRKNRNPVILGRNFDANVSTTGSVEQLANEGFLKTEQFLKS